MNGFPTIFDLLDRFAFLQGMPAVVGVLLAAVVIVAVRDWRLALAALLLQYLLAGLLFVEVIDPRLAIVKVLTGLFVCLILYVTARQVNWGRLPEDVSREEAIQLRAERQISFGPYLLPTTLPFRLFLALMMTLVVWTIARRPEFQLPAVTESHLVLAIYVLAGMGLLGVSLTGEPLRVGMGLLLFMTGFELFYHGLEQSVAMLTALAATNLVIALAIAYLAQVRHAPEWLFE